MGGALNTHHAVIDFGKHSGQLVTRLPVSYLNWAVTSGIDRISTLADGTKHPFHMIARAEIERRGERIQDVDVSLHAIDRISLRVRRQWHEKRGKDEGIASWAQRMVKECTTDYLGPYVDGVIIEYEGVVWVLDMSKCVPVLKTIKAAKQSKAECGAQ